MFIAYCILAVLYSGMLILSGITKLQHHPQVIQIIHELIGVPLEFFPMLAAAEFAGALGLLAGIRWLRLGIAAAIGVVIYFVGAIISHLLVGDVAGLGSPAFMLAIAGTLLAPSNENSTIVQRQQLILVRAVTMVAFTCTLALAFYVLFVCDEVNTGLT